MILLYFIFAMVAMGLQAIVIHNHIDQATKEIIEEIKKLNKP